MTPLLPRAKELQPEFVAFRRDFHRHPELGFQEVRTAGIVADYLRGLGLEVQTGVGGTGVVALIRGAQPGRTIAIRADMDALPIPEQSGVEYASLEPGKMHACGHDGHTAILLGVAKLLAERRQQIHGNVKLLFQHSEEGPSGARPMIEAGAMQHPQVDGVIALHLGTDLPVGKIGIMSGASTASADSFELTIHGKGGHGAHPHRSIDAIVAAGHVIVALQTLISRETDPLGAGVISIGTIQGGYRHNVIADCVVLTGTVRTVDPELQRQMPSSIERVVAGVCTGLRCQYQFSYNHGVPSVINDRGMVDLVLSVGRTLLGQDNAIEGNAPTMGGEDFSFFAAVAPGAMFRLGAGNATAGCDFPGHHPRFNFDEDAIPIGMAVLAESALQFLQR